MNAPAWLPLVTHGQAFWLPIIWAGLIGVAVAMYVVMDGFDLGIGILFTSAHNENWRDRMMLSVAPIWDGNETWLILGGGGVLAAFHLAYAIIMPAIYVPLLLMLIALVYRGVSFEFRFKSVDSKHWWDRSFHFGSLVATIAQGFVLGAFVQGFVSDGRRFTGGVLDWATPFSLLCAAGLVAGYGLLGATWCVMKTGGDLQVWARRMAERFLFAVLAAMAAVSLWVPFLSPAIGARWLVWPNIAVLAPVPLLTAACAWALWRALRRDAHVRPFLLTIALFLLGFVGLVVSLFPYIAPPHLTIWTAANTPLSQQFLLVGFAFALPMTLVYTGYVYWVFRGKIAEDIDVGAYH